MQTYNQHHLLYEKSSYHSVDISQTVRLLFLKTHSYSLSGFHCNEDITMFKTFCIELFDTTFVHKLMSDNIIGFKNRCFNQEPSFGTVMVLFVKSEKFHNTIYTILLSLRNFYTFQTSSHSQICRIRYHLYEK